MVDEEKDSFMDQAAVARSQLNKPSLIRDRERHVEMGRLMPLSSRLIYHVTSFEGVLLDTSHVRLYNPSAFPGGSAH